MSWTSTLALYSDNFARKRIVDSQGQSLTGIYELDINSIHVKLLRSYSAQPAILCCNLFTNWELNTNNILEKIYQPLLILQVSGRNGEEEIFTVNKSVPRPFHDCSEIQFWLDNFQRSKLSVDLSVSFMYRKQPAKM